MGHVEGEAYYRLGQEHLPDKFVVWGILIACRSVACLEAMRLTMRLGEFLPTTTDEVNALDRIYKGISISTITYEFYVNPNGVTWINAERIIHESSGRRLVLLSSGDQVIAYEMTAGMLISSMPKEVPDWLVKE
ncbi:unnamed protein product [marine sediment metagenome]|uniref:Uncharacterized protein n=1 Tax=marine sediment metagenome TaxID=412755 RepID=X1GG07_9ZZZZ